MDNETFYAYQSDMQNALNDAQIALNRIKECQSHIYHGEALEAILSLIDATANIRLIHYRRTNAFTEGEEE